MEKLFKNCYDMDRKCYESYFLTEDILMEHASSAMENFIREKFEPDSRVLIVAGGGNNGADGITLARLLNRDYRVRLFLPFGVKSEMAKLQLKRAEAVGVKVVNRVKKCDIAVDALFGAGLKRELNSKTIEIIEELNSLNAYKIACDIPTGLDEVGRLRPIAFKADTTITMGALKESLYSDMAKDFVGDVIVANLGVARELYEDDSKSFLLQESDFKPPIRDRQNSHKGSFGHLAVVTGEKSGAGTIAGLSGLRFGAGLVTLIYDREIGPQPPSLMVSQRLPKNTTAIAIGMGLGSAFSRKWLDKNIINSSTPIVLDADALQRGELLEVIKGDREVVITPHPKEFSRVLKLLEDRDISVKEIQNSRFDIAREFSKKYPNTVLLLKGANPIIAKDGKIFINPLGSQILAKGGSGDILSGLIASLLAQGRSALDSAINGSIALALLSQRYKGADFSATPEDLIELIKEL